MKRTLLSLVVMVGASLSVYGQQEMPISQYAFNYLLVNPAYAGTNNYGSASLLYRSQFVKLSGQPITYLASINGPVLKNHKVGLGLYIADNHLGVTNTTIIMGNFAYHIPITNNLKLSLGANAGVLCQHSSFNNLFISGAPLVTYRSGSTNSLLPQMGAGAYLYSDKFFVGLSAPQLFTYNPDNVVTIEDRYDYVRTYLFSGGINLEVNHNFVIKPCLILGYTAYSPISTNLNCNFLIRNFLWLGASYRFGDINEGISDNTIIGMIGLQITKHLRIAYSYDFDLSPLAIGSAFHEITIEYDFGHDVSKGKSLHRF